MLSVASGVWLLSSNALNDEYCNKDLYMLCFFFFFFYFFFQAEDGIRDRDVTGVQTCALPISVKMNIWQTVGRFD